MTRDDREFLNTIMDYADKVLPDLNPEKPLNGEQLQKLHPIFQDMAIKNHVSVEDIFVRYMDLAAQNAVTYKKKMNTNLDNLLDS